MAASERITFTTCPKYTRTKITPGPPYWVSGSEWIHGEALKTGGPLAPTSSTVFPLSFKTPLTFFRRLKIGNEHTNLYHQRLSLWPLMWSDYIPRYLTMRVTTSLTETLADNDHLENPGTSYSSTAGDCWTNIPQQCLWIRRRNFQANLGDSGGHTHGPFHC